VFERLTERARQVVVVLAQEEARTLKHSYIGTEHILLGLLREDEGLAARVLESLDITVERVRGQVVRIVGSGEEVTSGQIPFTPRAKKVLELALREALSLGHNYVGTEHILLALVRENEGVAARILLDFDADGEKIRGEVIRMLSGPNRQRPVGQTTGSRRAPNPLRPPFDWEHAGVLWRPDRLVGALLHELEGVASRLLEQQFDLRVSRVRSRPLPRAIAHGAPSARIVPAPSPLPRSRQAPSPVRGLRWERATFLWRPEGLELRVPLNLDQGAMAAFATDLVWDTGPLAELRREIWDGWLALASPTLLDDLDPDELRRSVDAAVSRALEASDDEPDRVQTFLGRLRGAAPVPEVRSHSRQPEKREHVPLAEAQQLLPFTILVPEQVPADWQVDCTWIGPSQLPAAEAWVQINYQSDSGLENAQLHEFAIGDARYPDTSTDIWEEIQANGRTLHVVRPKAHLPRAMLALERDGTSLYITSETLKRGRIITLATTLVPVPDAA
jgi:hypothetical protein